MGSVCPLLRHLGDRETGCEELRENIAVATASGIKYWVPFLQGLLAEIEVERQDVKQALTRVDEALGLAQQTGEHWSDAFLHRIRGELLLKRDPANTLPAEEAFLSAIAIAQQQKARTFELRAAMRSLRDVETAVAASVPVTVSPLSHCYRDVPYAEPSADPRQAERQGRVGQRVYYPRPSPSSFDWEPAEALPGRAAHVAGVEAAIWAETISDFDAAIEAERAERIGIGQQAISEAARTQHPPEIAIDDFARLTNPAL
jgi:hypothetical protein